MEVEKFKTELDSTSNKAKMAGTLFERRLDDNLSMLNKNQDAAKDKKQDSPSKASKKQLKRGKNSHGS